MMSNSEINFDCSKLLGFDMLVFSEQSQTMNELGLEVNSGENFNKISEIQPTAPELLDNVVNKVSEIVQSEPSKELANVVNKVGELVDQ